MSIYHINYKNVLRAALMTATVLLASTTMMAQSASTGVVVHGNVYGGGNLADVKTNTEVNMSAGHVYGNVFGGGKGKADNFKCDKAMVGEEKQENACANPGSDENKDKGTIVTISNGTVGTLVGEEGSQTLKKGTGNVYGGGEIGRVEWNTQVRIGVGTGEGTFAPVIYGNVFGAGKGMATHGYSALVRGNSTVTIQGNAKVGYNVYGGGEMSTVGRYWVKGIPITYTCDGETVPTAPETLPDEMPYKTRRGGTITVTVQGKAQIGPDNGATETAGHVFGAGKGVTPNYVQTGDKENWSRRMVDYKSTKHTGEPGTTWDYYEAYTEDQIADTNFPKYVWEYFVDDANPSATNYKTGKDKYFEFLQTLALVTGTEVTIGGDGVVKGNVYGGSESGFVQDNTRVTIKGSNCEIGTTTYGNVFGGGRGLDTFAEAGKVKGTTTVAIEAGAVKGNVYGGGELGDIGLIDKTDKNDKGELTYNYFWKQSDGSTANADENNKITGTNNNTGICTVTISDGTIGIDNPTDASEHGNVFGAGKGRSDTFWCEKAIAYKATVEITDGTVKGNVYGGGQIGRVETDTEVTIGAVSTGGTGEGTGSGEESGSGESTTPPAPVILGSVFGAGAGAETHGYSALVRGDTKVTIQGYAQVAKSVYGGGEKASVGRYGLNAQKMPNILVGGGRCEVDVKDHATIGEDVFGAGKGIDPVFDENDKPQRMTAVDGVSTWESFDTADAYFTFLETLALVTHPEVTIDGNATVGRSVFGGGELGLTKGSVIVNIKGGTIGEDVYGGGALANTNTTELVAENYPTTTPETNSDGSIITKEVSPTTTVNLIGGTIMGDAYGGGLGQLGDNPVEAVVYGDITVTLGEENSAQATKFNVMTYEGKTIVKSGRIFGCNNLNGSPQGDVTVRVWKTVAGNGGTQVRTTAEVKAANKAIMDAHPDDYETVTGYETPTYEVAAVYGGGNLANYTATGKKTNVIIETCDVSIESVYGGGNAAAVPQTDVLVKGAYEIGTVFGGGNGKDQYTLDGGEHWITNPGANVNGNANTLLTGGYVHEAYGGSNEKGTITGDVTIDVGQGGCCDLDLGKLVGAGKNADVNGDLKIIMGCKPEVKVPLVFGGADNANVNGDVELTITSGNWGTVVGGNNNGGIIMGHIILNIEETTCIPIKIDELYGCGYNALYSQYGYYVKTTTTEGTPIGAPSETADLTDDGKLQFMPRQSANDPHLPVNTYSYSESGASWTVLPITGDNKFEGYASPEVNIISCTSIGQVFGGGYGTTATVYGNPTVNINMIPGAHADEIDRDKDGNADGNANALGTIGDVYGGGDAAAVYGNTTVNIGTITSTSVHTFAQVNGEYKVQYQADGVTPIMEPKTVTGAYITGDVYGGGKLADVGKTHLAKDENDKDIDVIDIKGSTFVNIGAVKGAEILDAQNNGTGRYNYTSVSFTAENAPGIFIGGNVYGGGKGEAAEPKGTDALPGAFRCGKAMVTKNTNVAIGNGTIGDGNADHGHVYGGGEKGRVEENTSVTIGCEDDANSKPVITGNVFGAGKGVNTHGYSALARGNSYVTVQGEAKVKKSVYGGGEIASVGKYNINAQGLPESLANQGSGYCTVIVRDNAVIGPDAAMVMTAEDYPDDYGHVFGAGKGVLPYEGYADNAKAWRVTPTNTKQEYLSKNEAIAGTTNEKGYLPYVETLGLATQTYVTIDENAFVKGSVYGGSENGYVQHDTQVNIKGNCQIGNGYVQMADNGTYLAIANMRGVNRRYTAKEWEEGHLFVTGDTEVNASDPSEAALRTDVSNNYTSSLPECASWPYGQATGDNKYAPWDMYDGTENYDSKGGRTTADDGHTFYGNVFGGGSGVIPYRPGQWHPEAGSVGGNTEVNITGGHILTNIYGGNELTDVYGKCTVNFGGTATLGVPRTLKQIAAHPLTCYLFGAGKGDQRVLFNKKTNVKEVEVNITGGTIYGSVFGGGEDGHVHRDVNMTIGNDDHSGPTIGQWGTSYVDGNVFGGGRGFGADAYTAGNVAGSVKLDIKGGSILGSVYGGGRLGSVGYGLFDEGVEGYGEMRPDYTVEEGNPTSAENFKRGYIDITISGGTIGNNREYIIPNATNMAEAGIPEADRDISKWNNTNNYWTQWKEYHKIPKTEFDTTTGRLTHTKGGNVFAGGMGNFYKQDGQTYINGVDWWKLGNAKSTTVTITGGTIKSNVYGGSELGQVVGHHTTTNAAGESINASTEISISGSAQIGTEVVNGGTTEYTFGSVFGGGYGSLRDDLTVNGVTSHPKFDAGLVKEDTKIDMQGGVVKASIYGGGEMASVGSVGESNSVVGSTYVTVSGGTVGIQPITVSDTKRYFGGAKMGNVYGGGSGYNNTVRSGRILKNTNVTINGGTIYHNVYGGGAYGTVGDFDYQTGSDTQGGPVKVQGINGLATTGTGVANVTIKGGTIGYDGKENGMVFGSSRGDINEPGARDDHCAWVYDTNVIIGTEGSETGPQIKGTVYGSGENGHTYNNTVVTVNSGTIGIADSSNPGYTVTSNGKSYSGAEYPYRGNVYGGGCGTDKYYENHDLETHDGNGQLFNSLAGIVYGTTTVNITGGTVVRNVYGAGAMGSVGKTVTTTNESSTTTTITGGTTTIKISGGTIGVDGTNGDGNVFGAARGDVDAISNKSALVKKETGVSVTGGTIKGNVYGGGELGCVGTFTVSRDMRTFTWQDTDGDPNTAANSDNKNTGVCNVTVDGSSAVINGHVYGAGKGKEDTFWCEKGITYSTNVNIKNGTVNQNVYGGGEVGRVETDTQVKIGNGTGTAEGTFAPTIMGSIFGGGAGVETHGYSALVRGNTTVTVEGNADVRKSIYGGGMIASVGRYGLDEHDMPSILQGGGYCYVTVQGSAQIGEDVFGAGKGVTPAYTYVVSDDYDVRMNNSKRMVPYSPYNETTKKGQKESDWKKTWDYVEDYPTDYSGIKFVWEYFDKLLKYSTYLETLALATHPEVTIDGNATVSGSVFGGGELGLTKGSVIVTIKGGTIEEDVYGGGSLANTNTTSTVDLDGNGTTENIDPTTTVNLKGGTINRNVYGGGLGQLAKAAVAAQPAQGTEGEEGYVPAVAAQPAVSAVEAKVYGEVLVKLNEPTTTTTGEGEGATTTTTYGDCEVKGTIFGCNNLNGSPQKNVTVHVYKTVTKSKGAVQPKPTKNTDIYEVTAVYGGGNLAAYYPDDATARETAIANVIIDGCDLTSIKSVYGGGNAASVPATEVVVNGTYEIDEVFGGGNGLDDVSYDGGVNYVDNPGANVGLLAYPNAANDAYDTKENRETNYGYGSGKAHATIFGGTVHTVYGGSNTKGNVRKESCATLMDADECEFNVEDAYGGGNNALQDGDAVLDVDCISGLGKAYGGASNADVNGDVTLSITNGTYGQVFGGNDMGGCIRGSISVNIEETGCRPIVIGELYGGGNQAAYSIYGYDADGKVLTSGSNPVKNPEVNVKSFTSIGTIYGGGYGASATMVGSPTVNINVYEGKYYKTFHSKDNTIGENAKVVGTHVKYSASDTGYADGYPIPKHEKGKIGAINNVFGGGNEAEVIGNPTLNIGTEAGEEVYVEVEVKTGESVVGYYTRTGEGTYTSATGTADAATHYYLKTTKAVDIRGDVYGGGNNAEVEGNTEVQIGKKITE